MACEATPGKIAQWAGRISAGITRLVSKRSFYAGMAVGAAGTGALTLALNSVRSRTRPVGSTRVGRILPGAEPGQEPVLFGTRTRPKPLPGLSRSPAPGTRANPKSIPIKAGRSQARNQTASRKKKKPVGSTVTAEKVPDNLAATSDSTRPQTKLKPAQIQIQTRSGESLVAKNSYRVMRPDGTETGLAVTPVVIEPETDPSTQTEGHWMVTHIRTGAAIGGPLKTVSEAHGLATKLSPLPWPEAQLPPADIARAKEIVDEYLEAGSESRKKSVEADG